MAYVYIIKSSKTGRYYIGCSEDPLQRLGEHNSGKVAATRNFRPWEFIFKQEYTDLNAARKIEARVKKLKRRDYIDKIIYSGVIRFRPTSSSGRALPF